MLLTTPLDDFMFSFGLIVNWVRVCHGPHGQLLALFAISTGMKTWRHNVGCVYDLETKLFSSFAMDNLTSMYKRSQNHLYI